MAVLFIHTDTHCESIGKRTRPDYNQKQWISISVVLFPLITSFCRDGQCHVCVVALFLRGTLKFSKSLLCFPLCKTKGHHKWKKTWKNARSEEWDKTRGWKRGRRIKGWPVGFLFPSGRRRCLNDSHLDEYVVSWSRGRVFTVCCGFWDNFYSVCKWIVTSFTEFQQIKGKL